MTYDQRQLVVGSENIAEAYLKRQDLVSFETGRRGGTLHH
jgi:hypothetical protein